jgi:hypothetical protein
MHLRAFAPFVAVLSALALLLASSAAAEAPTFRAPATITGSAVVGGQLEAHNGSWLYDNGMSCKEECVMSYWWQRCDAAGSACADISGAANRFYTVQAADAGSRLRAMEMMSKYDCGAGDSQTGIVPCRWDSRTAPSGMTDVVPGSAPTGGTTTPTTPPAPKPQAPLAPAVTTAPEVKGVAMVDEILSATRGTWSGSPTLALEWQRCDARGENCEGTGLSTETYTAIPFDIGKTLRVQITASNVAGARTATSAVTEVISELKPTEAKTWIPAAKVTPPHRLLIDETTAKPARFAKRGPVTVALRIADDRGFKIQGALVTAVVLPGASLLAPPEATTDEEGLATLVFTPGPKLNLKKKGTITIVITARRPGDKLSSPRAAVERVKITVPAAKTKRLSGR